MAGKGAAGSPLSTTCCQAAPVATSQRAENSWPHDEIQRLIARRRLSISTPWVEGIFVTDSKPKRHGTASIPGAYLALCDALATIGSSFDDAVSPLRSSVAAISVGIVDGEALLDLDYSEDVEASVDMNVVMTGDGRFIEIQGTGEEATFSEAELQKLLALARIGINRLTELQRTTLAE
jgi:ribonuclease PH